MSLAKLTSVQLKKLAVQCGINRTGTKAELTARLLKDVFDAPRPDQDIRVLSVDLGIRNLAFSLVTPPQEKSKDGAPTLHEWRRLDLTVANGEAEVYKEAAKQGFSEQKPASHNAAEPTALSPSSPSPDPFSPRSLSLTALHLVRAHLLPLRPTHILMERQRFRSGSNPKIFEWTIRVNSLEAMLHATFATLQAEGRWRGEVVSMEPKAILGFVLDEIGSSGGKESETAEREGDVSGVAEKESVKVLKINHVGGLFNTQPPNLVIADEAQAMRAAYLKKWNRTKHRRTPSNAGKVKNVKEITEEPLKKLDDLADCLVQGLTYLKWRANTRQLQAGGQDVINEMLGDTATKSEPKKKTKSKKKDIGKSTTKAKLA